MISKDLSDAASGCFMDHNGNHQNTSNLFFSLLLVIVSLFIVSIIQEIANINNNAFGSASPSDFNFAAVGDWDCTQDTEATVNNIISQDPELIVGLGDYSYEDTADCWFDIVDPIDDKMKIAIGNHDIDPASLNSLMLHFNLSQQFYSFDYQNVHFIVLATELGYLDMDTSRAQEQLAFVEADLEEASSNPNVDWIIPFFHRMMYYKGEESSIVREDDHNLKKMYHPLFEKYGVNLVLYAHSHTYERTYPIRFNEEDPDNPIVASKALNDYNSTDGGLVAVTVGTAGANFSGFHGDSEYTPVQFKELHGFLNVQVFVYEKKLVGTFYDNNAGKKAEFTIQKKAP